MLIPLAIGLLVRARYAETAAGLQPTMAQAANTSLILVFVAMLVLNFETLLGAIGTGAIVAVFVLIALTFVAGYFLAGADPGARSVVGLGTAQRNVSAALVVATSNFTDPDVLIIILVGALLMLVILMPLAGEIGKRQTAPAAAT